MDEGWSYLHPEKEFSTEFKEKGSRFIGFLAPAETQDEAMDFLDRLRRSYHDATHHCWAFRVGWTDNLESRFSDDGEPSRTAGPPILASIENAGVSDACIVVVRYFGGTKLGTGGLIRAYRTAARSVLEEAPLKKKILCSDWSVELPWGAQGILRHQAEKMGIRISEKGYNELLTLQASVPRSSEREFLKFMENLKDSWKGAVTWRSK